MENLNNKEFKKLENTNFYIYNIPSTFEEIKAYKESIKELVFNIIGADEEHYKESLECSMFHLKAKENANNYFIKNIDLFKSNLLKFKEDFFKLDLGTLADSDLMNLIGYNILNNFDFTYLEKAPIEHDYTYTSINYYNDYICLSFKYESENASKSLFNDIEIKNNFFNSLVDFEKISMELIEKFYNRFQDENLKAFLNSYKLKNDLQNLLKVNQIQTAPSIKKKVKI